MVKLTPELLNLLESGSRRRINEGVTTSDLYRLMKKMEVPSFNSFLVDVQEVLRDEVHIRVTTEELDRAFKRLLATRV